MPVSVQNRNSLEFHSYFIFIVGEDKLINEAAQLKEMSSPRYDLTLQEKYMHDSLSDNK